MNRRQALQGIAGLAVAGAAMADSRAGAAPPSASADRDWDLIVVGGGFAGVTAARDASLRGARTLLLEARPRLGGRTGVVDFGGHRIEIGGTWIGPGQPHVWAERMRYSLPLAESAAAAATRYVWYDGERRVEGSPAQYWAMMNPAYDAFYAPARERLPRPFDPLYVEGNERLDRLDSAEAIAGLDITPAQRALLLSFAAINGHSASNRSSYLDQLRWFALGGFSSNFMWDNLSRFRLAGGTDGLIRRMMIDGSAEVRLDAPVVRVARTAGAAEVTTASGDTFAGHAVVVALPLNVLSRIDFRPAISPIKIAASRRRHTGSGTKVYARVAGRHPVVFANGPERLPLNFLWTEYDDADGQLLVGFGPSPRTLDTSNLAAVERAVRDYLPDARLLEAHSHDWNEDPFSLGTWCMYPPGMLTGSLRELQRPEDNLFFAGSDIASGWRGFIDGAIESGSIAATAAIEFLNARRA
jgi:pseudooxynicotine oxidase